MKKAQSSLEFLMILGIAFAFITILGAIFLNVSTSSKNNLDNEQINKIGIDLLNQIEEIYFRGNGNKITYKANFPQDITNFTINYVYVNSTLNYTYLNITKLKEGTFTSNLFFTSENYIHFECEVCYNVTVGTLPNQNITFYFNESTFNKGPKTLSIRAFSDKVYLDFVR